MHICARIFAWVWDLLAGSTAYPMQQVSLFAFSPESRLSNNSAIAKLTKLNSSQYIDEQWYMCNNVAVLRRCSVTVVFLLFLFFQIIMWNMCINWVIFRKIIYRFLVCLMFHLFKWWILDYYRKEWYILWMTMFCICYGNLYFIMLYHIKKVLVFSYVCKLLLNCI